MSAEAIQSPSLFAFQRGRVQEPRRTDFWPGPAVFARETVEIRAGETGEVPINLHNLKKAVPAEKLALLDLTGRSNLAQRGGDLLHGGAREIATQLISGRRDTTTIPIVNRSERPLTVAKGEVARLFARQGGYIEDERLVAALKAGEIRITNGTEGKEWWVQHNEDGMLIGIGFTIVHPEKTIIPGDTPIPSPTSARGNFRANLDTYLTPITEKDDPLLCISATKAILGFDQSLIGIIEPTINISPNVIPPGISIANKDHLNALVLDPEDEWDIRTETRKSLPNKAIIIQFMTREA